jgi:photosystem II stability/assembly factor-like uncharacterized protein
MKYLFLLVIVVFCGSVFSQSWQPIGPFYGKKVTEEYMHSMGYTSAVYMDPINENEILMGTNSSGIWKTIDRGITWKCVTENTDLIPGMGVQSIAVNPQNPNMILAAASNFTYSCDKYGGEVLISNNKGDTWSILETFKVNGWQDEITKILFKNKDEIYVATSTKVFHSKDNGNTWEVIFKIDDKQEYVKHKGQKIIDFELLKGNTILISSTHKWGDVGQVWRTKDGGGTWKALVLSGELKELKKEHIYCVKLATPINNRSVITLSNGKVIYIYESTNNGESYSKLGEFNTSYDTGDAKASKFEIELSKLDSNKIYFGFIEFFEWTKQKGLKMLSPSTNISKEEHDDVRRMKVYISPKTQKEYLLMGNDGGVSIYYPEENKFESLNGMSLATVQVYNMGMSQYGDDFKILIGTQDNGTFQYQNNEWHWVAGGDGGAAWLSKEGDKQFHCVNATLSFKNGNTKRYFTPNKRKSGWFLDYPAEMKSDDNTIVFGSEKRGGARGARLFVQKTMDNPNFGIEIDRLGGIGEIEISDYDNNLMYIAGNDWNDKNSNTPRLLKTINGGKQFTDLTNSTVYSDDYNDTTTLFDILSYRLISDVEIDPLDDEIIYISLTGVLLNKESTNTIDFYRVLKSYDAGLTWVDFTKGLPIVPTHKLIRHAGAKELIFCGNDKGMYYRGKGDNSWKDFNTSFPKNQAVTDLKINYCQNKLYSATFGRGIWSVNIPEYKKVTKKILNDTKWDVKEKFQLTDLIIKKKRTLEITNDLVLAKNCKIVLEPKSKLILNGGEVITKCSGVWDKIVIEEKKFLFIFKKKKGKVVIIDKKE